MTYQCKLSSRRYTESYWHNQIFDQPPKTYCFGINIRLLLLVSIARTTGMKMSVERQRIANLPDNDTFFPPEI